ncbi:MAG: FAD binding domain-containing protein [Pseudolabrys sp.]|nr:FAD binding domain-containing protein [Pseudolabrys sp.]
MKPSPFQYYDPKNLDDALSLLGRHEGARVLAGGQSLMPMLNFRFVQPDHLIDLNGINELAGIEFKSGSIRFGAMTRQREIEFSAEIADVCPVLHAALAHVGHRQTRNRGTIGGSLCHLDPSAELVNCINLHDGALIHLQSKRGGRRDLAFSDFAAGFMTHNTADDEIVVAVTLPTWNRGHGYSFVECARRRGDFAIAAVAALLDVDDAGLISRAAISIAGVTPNAVRAGAAERALVGQKPGSEAFRAAAASLAFDEPLEDAYVTKEYRLHLGEVLTRRALEAATKRLEASRNV